MKLLIILLFSYSFIFADLPTIIPSKLKKDDLIALVFPASFLDEESKIALSIMKSKVEWLQKKGYRTIFYPSLIRRNGYLSGTDSERAQAFMDAWENEAVKAIWCFRGGYGSQKILELLDYEIIKANPKILIGMSDVTALHHAIQQKTGLVTFLAPVLNYFGEEKSEFNDYLNFSSLEALLTNKEKNNTYKFSDLNIEVIIPGKARGKLVGGNLSLIASLCGTKWQLNTTGKVLILEEVSESAYRIDRMLWQLKNAKLLDSPAAVIIGSFVDCRTSLKFSLELKKVFENYFKDASYPVIMGFPSGHGNHQMALPLNTTIEINTHMHNFSFLETPVSSH